MDPFVAGLFAYFLGGHQKTDDPVHDPPIDHSPQAIEAALNDGDAKVYSAPQLIPEIGAPATGINLDGDPFRVEPPVDDGVVAALTAPGQPDSSDQGFSTPDSVTVEVAEGAEITVHDRKLSGEAVPQGTAGGTQASELDDSLNDSQDLKISPAEPDSEATSPLLDDRHSHIPSYFPEYFQERPGCFYTVVGAGLAFIAAAIALTVAVIGGGGGSQSAGTHASTFGATETGTSGSLPKFFDRSLEFSASSSASGPSTYIEVLRPGRHAGQFVEADSYPSTSSSQLLTERFSAGGVVVTNLETSSPSGATSFQFSTPLPVIKGPFAVGTSWTTTSTGTSSSGQDTVQENDRISAISQTKVSGFTLREFVVTIHHVITESTPSGTVSQVSTGTEGFSPLLGVFVSGQSTEVTAGKSTTNTFQLQSIGAPSSATGSGSSNPSASPTPSGSPVFTMQPQNQTCAPSGTAAFKAVASGATKLQWQTSKDHGATWVDVPGGTAPAWSQECTPALNGAEFRLEASSASGQTTTSNAATVTVTGPTTSGSLRVSCPASVTQGQSIQITITVPTPSEPVKVNWMLPNGSTVLHTAMPNSTDPTTEHDAIGTSEAGPWKVVASAGGQTATCPAITVNG